MNYYVFLVIVIYSLNGHCFSLESIIGGDEANSENPINYQVSVQLNGIHRCGGGIVGEKFIITVAHCVAYGTTGIIVENHLTIVIAYNILHPESSVKRFELDRVYLPKSYIGSIRHVGSETNYEEGDIAVLKLDSELGLAGNSNLSKLELVDRNFSHLRKFFVIAGHGTSRIIHSLNERTALMTRYHYSDGKLRYAVAESVSNYNCSILNSRSIHNSNMCAKLVQRDINRPEGVCVGDSGSPLVYNGNILVGILDSGWGNCSEVIRPALYTKVSYYLTFIRNALKNKRTSKMRVAVAVNDINLHPTLVEI